MTEIEFKEFNIQESTSVNSYQSQTQPQPQHESELQELNEISIEDKIFFNEPLIIDESTFKSSTEFQRGVSEAMGICGMYSAFSSSGIAYDDCITLILSIMNSKLAGKISEDNKEASVQCPFAGGVI